jgi:hypothetical protein
LKVREQTSPEGWIQCLQCDEAEKRRRSEKRGMELARGIEPSNRRRIGSEACLTGSCREGQPPRMLPTKGTHPLRDPWLEVRFVELARGIEPPTCGL